MVSTPYTCLLSFWSLHIKQVMIVFPKTTQQFWGLYISSVRLCTSQGERLLSLPPDEPHSYPNKVSPKFGRALGYFLTEHNVQNIIQNPTPSSVSSWYERDLGLSKAIPVVCKYQLSLLCNKGSKYGSRNRLQLLSKNKHGESHKPFGD